MSPEQAQQLLDRIELLEKKLNEFYYPDRYQFPRSLRHMGPQLGFYGKPLINQPSPTGVSTGFTQSAGLAFNANSSSTGGTGLTSYNFGDIVLHLKQLGLLTA